MPLFLCYLHFMSGVQRFLISRGSCCGNENENILKDVECCFDQEPQSIKGRNVKNIK